MKEEKFYDKIKGSLLYKTTEGKHKTLDEYINDNKEKNGNKVYYVTDENQQIQYINLFRNLKLYFQAFYPKKNLM